MACDEGYPVEYYHYAAVIHAEARGEGYNGMIATLSALRNGARGYNVGRLDPEIVELVAEGMKKDVGHRYKHWIRFELATDTRQVRIAMRALRDGDGVWVGRHWFY